jgi:hypothetical protein
LIPLAKPGVQAAIDHFFFKPGQELTFLRDERKRVIGFMMSNRGPNWDGPAPAGLTFIRVIR